MGIAPGLTPEHAQQAANHLRSIIASRQILADRLSPRELAEIDAEIASFEAALFPPDPVTFHEYAQHFTSWQFHRWQTEILIPLIQRLATETGLRILFHAPPQYGKSHLLSVRGPAWLIGRRPDIKIGLACYNIKRATDFSKDIRDLLLHEEHQKFFPDPAGHINKKAPESGFFTAARKARRDAQPSLNAMGLQSGFVGLGIGPGDLLIIDDPYSDPKQAQSEQENANVINFWKRAARPRVNEHANVIVMFHRYVDLDLCGVLLEEGGWEYIRLPAFMDENEDGADPTHHLPGIREPDGRLSPLNSTAWLNAMKAADTFVFLGQFQGTPRIAGGNIFKEAWFRYYRETDYAYIVNGEVIPKDRCWRFQSVDFAVTEKTTGNFTVDGTWAVTPRKQILLLNRVKEKFEGPEVKALVHQQFRMWQQPQPSFIAADRTGLGNPLVQDLEREGLPMRGLWMHTDKTSRAIGAAARYEAGQVFHPEDTTWVCDLEKELTGFPNAANDDQVDMVSMATSMIAAPSVVLPEFSPAGHVSTVELPLIDGPPLIVGWGLDPVPAWCVAQEFEGQLRVLACGAARPGTGILDYALSLADRLKREFGSEVETEHYAACRPGTATTMHQDVARLLAYGDDGEREGPGWMLGQAEPQREIRDEAIRNRLKTMARGMPALFLDPACRELADALSGGYAFKQQANGALSEQPEKNAAFALVEALGCVVTSVYASGWSARQSEEDWSEPVGSASGAGRRRR